MSKISLGSKESISIVICELEILLKEHEINLIAMRHNKRSQPVIEYGENNINSIKRTIELIKNRRN